MKKENIDQDETAKADFSTDDCIPLLNKERINTDLSSLNGHNWLTDTVINEYGNLIKKHFTDIFVFSTHFLTSLKNRGFENMKGWTKMWTF